MDDDQRDWDDLPEEDLTADKARELRASLRPAYPEIDELYSNFYVADVLRVPGRTYEYARDEKLKGALEWRRSYNVEALVRAFSYDEMRGILKVERDRTANSDDDDDDDRPPTPRFTPSQSLINVCESGAFFFAGFDNSGRGIIHARASWINWWKTGVEDGIRYHILVIEYALWRLSERNKFLRDDGDNDDPTSESLVLCVDTSNLPLMPPPLGMFTEMASLMQKAFPDRVHRIYIGPVNGFLRTLYDMVKPYLRPRSRDKIVLLDCVPEAP